MHLALRRGKTSLAIGSGVLYERAGKTYIVTAWHNVTGRHTESLKCLSRNLATPDNVIATISCRMSSQGNEVGYIRRGITVPLEIDGKTTYYIHPQGWPRVDVVAIPIDPKGEYLSEGQVASGEQVNFSIPLVSAGLNGSVDSDIEHIQDAEASTSYINADLSQYLYASDDIFVLGYPKGITDYTGQPVWKRASVASSPHLGWNRQPQFLVDCASKEGMSGAPAIFHNRKGSIQIGGTKYITSGPATVLHGIYVGRLGSTSEFEAQLGCVWKKSVIDEVIDSAIHGPISDETMLPDTVVLECIKKQWPEEANYAESILDENCHYISYFVHSVMSALNGRANPDEVRNLVKMHAKSILETGA
ncbi:MAG: hypothetical protein COW18_05715 [Zetaproteobacteria bacterium CG12_big_fil_rev_8_21_14_0_65_54_13]|nr:MAG: hypothetical protein COW18_05715 [Zetaproteobacteria bacterium CG12_big_fil_rev_8_21_14_0_65_54_13]